MLGQPIEKRSPGESEAVQDAPSPAPVKELVKEPARESRTRDAKARDGAAPNGKEHRSRRRGHAEPTDEKSPPQTKRSARSEPPKSPPKSPQPKPAATAFGDHVPAFLLRQAPVPPAA